MKSTKSFSDVMSELDKEDLLETIQKSVHILKGHIASSNVDQDIKETLKLLDLCISAEYVRIERSKLNK